MINYEYKCKDCKHVQEEMRRMDDRDTPAKCEECGGESVMCISHTSFKMKKYKRIYGKRVDEGHPSVKAPR